MVQLFIGHKPGVGAVLKCLKYDTDDALTLANNAYERLYFNSENQKLSYVFPADAFYFRNAELSGLPEGVFSVNQGKIVGRKTTFGSFYDVTIFYKINAVYPELTYPPIPEVRRKDLNNGRTEASVLDVTTYSAGGGLIEAYQYRYQMVRVASFDTASSTQTLVSSYNGKVISAMSGQVALGSLVLPIDGGSAYFDDRRAFVTYPSIWDLPADSSPMRSYAYQPDLLMLEASQSRFTLAFPGHSIYDTGLHTKIIDSERSPALCIMNGVRNNIAAGTSVTIPAPPGVILSERLIMDFIFRGVGDDWWVPSRIPYSLSAGRRSIYYTVQSNSITIYNDGEASIDVRYVVFNADDNGNSSGGNLVMFSANDGERDFTQIKVPGSSDPASRPNDILFDTRFPAFQIIDEGFIPIESFYDTPAIEKNLGTKKIDLPFTNGGLTPYLKFSIVFPNCMTTPFWSYQIEAGGNSSSSNVSVLARLRDNNVTFWSSPGNWSRKGTDSTGKVEFHYDLPDPVGVRYYLFGISQ